MNENKKVPASRRKSEASTKKKIYNEIITPFPDNVKRVTGNSQTQLTLEEINNV